jgi:vancomycin resistance protein YoaR
MKYICAALFLFLTQQTTVPDNLLVTYQGQIVANVNRIDFTITSIGDPFINGNKYLIFIEELEKKIYQEPVNASIDKKGSIITGQVGYNLDRQKFTEQFYSYYTEDGPATLEVPVYFIYPKVDSELLADIRTKQIGDYSTYFNSNNKERTHNISLAAEAINNQVVFSGETFSFNQVVGKRTKKKGYLPAPVIVRGELSEGVGGGICQVSSTLYNAVDSAGLQIVQRYSHSRSVPYVPPGRDATVSWYGPDFVFKNEHNQPILIRAKIYGGKMIVKIYSSDVINYEQRQVPSAPDQLPKEVKIGSELNTTNQQ